MVFSQKLHQEKFLAAMAERLNHFGYKLKKSRNSFLKKYEWGMTSIHMAFIKHHDDFDTTVDVAIRFNELEEFVGNKNKDIFTMGAELGNLVDGEPKRWTVASEADIPAAADGMMKKIIDVAFPYIEKYSNKQVAFETLSGEGPSSWIHSPIHGKRAIRAIGLALLLGKKDEACRLIETKRPLLRDPFDQKYFEDFVSLIQSQLDL